MDLNKFFYLFFVLTSTNLIYVVTISSTLENEQIFTNKFDSQLNLNDTLVLNKNLIQGSSLSLANVFTQSHDSDLDDLEDVFVLKAVSDSIHEWQLRKKTRQARQAAKSNNSTKKRVKRDEEVVCYRNFGCFRDEGPFDYLDTLPASPEVINTTFTLYTRTTLKTSGEILDYENVSTIKKSNMQDNKPVKVIIHGFGSSGKRPWVLQMAEALIYTEDVNVIVVDWENGATLPNYVQAAANTQLVGKQVAYLIKTINQNRNLKSNNYHLIGFSLGAHIAGFAGAEVQNISRITGLDPASPLFEGYSIRVRLDPSDADFVDVIHSNGDFIYKGGLGSFKPMGHIDFYPNGGRVQVGCNSVIVGVFADIIYGKWQSLCHHRRAFRFFIDSLVPSCRFHAFSCSSYDKFLKGDCFDCGESGRNCANMGYFANHSKSRGKMYLMTRNAEPFCSNQYKIKILSSNMQQSTWGKLEISFISLGANETFPLTSESDEIKNKAILQGLVVAHPIIKNITNVLLRYTKFKGWIHTGKDFWAIDKILLQNSDGELFSYCGYNTIIRNNESVLLDLERKNCTLYEANIDLPTARVARLIWKVVASKPPSFASLLWNFSGYNPINNSVNKFSSNYKNNPLVVYKTNSNNFNSNFNQNTIFNSNSNSDNNGISLNLNKINLNKNISNKSKNLSTNKNNKNLIIKNLNKNLSNLQTPGNGNLMKKNVINKLNLEDDQLDLMKIQKDTNTEKNFYLNSTNSAISITFNPFNNLLNNNV